MVWIEPRASLAASGRGYSPLPDHRARRSLDTLVTCVKWWICLRSLYTVYYWVINKLVTVLYQLLWFEWNETNIYLASINMTILFSNIQLSKELFCNWTDFYDWLDFTRTNISTFLLLLNIFKEWNCKTIIFVPFFWIVSDLNWRGMQTRAI